MARIIPYMFCIGLIGIFMLVIMRKKFIIDYRLHFPSGTATGILISGFHTPKGEVQARQQVTALFHGPFVVHMLWSGCLHCADAHLAGNAWWLQ